MTDEQQELVNSFERRLATHVPVDLVRAVPLIEPHGSTCLLAACATLPAYELLDKRKRLEKALEFLPW